MDDMLTPIVRESLRAIVGDEECCRLLRQALINSNIISETLSQADNIKAEIANLVQWAVISRKESIPITLDVVINKLRQLSAV